jgi:hypothetical protein
MVTIKTIKTVKSTVYNHVLMQDPPNDSFGKTAEFENNNINRLEKDIIKNII